MELNIIVDNGTKKELIEFIFEMEYQNWSKKWNYIELRKHEVPKPL